MLCHKENIFSLLEISHVKPPGTQAKEILDSELNPVGITFNSQNHFIAGTRIDSCNINYKIRMDKAHHRIIKRFAGDDKYIYILAQKMHANEVSRWFRITLLA